MANVAHSPSSAQSTVIEEQPGRSTLIEQEGTFMVTDGDGNPLFVGDEVAAEFKFWRTTFGVPDDEGVAE